jgi:hypothetical protein
MDYKARNKVQTTILRGEKDIDEIVPVIESAHMPADMKETCIKIAKEELSKYFFKIENVSDQNINFYKKLSKKIKTALEADKGETWNVIVGTDFGAYCAFEKNNMIYFKLNEVYFLFFRFGSNSTNN